MDYMLIDTHAHLNFLAFNKDRDEVIKRCLRDNAWVINVGTNYETSKKAIEIAQNYSQGVYASVGLHPINLETGLVKIKFDEQEGKHLEKEFDYEKYKKLAQSKKVIAVGEIGFDYYWKPKTTKKKELFKEKQEELFLDELNLAKELNLPVIFHCRMAHDDLIKTLNTNYLLLNTNLRGVIHCFTGTWEQAQQYMDMGFYLGFNGLIFRKIEGIEVAETSSHLPPRATSSRSVFDEIIKNTPLDRILIETDCPYLPPPQFQSQRNEPLYVKFVAEKIAEIKKVSFDKVAEITTENAKKLFKI